MADNTNITARSNDWWRRVVRTLVQLIISGAFYGITQQIAGDVDPSYTPYVLGIYTLIVVGAQNLAEDLGLVPALLKGKASSGENPSPDPAGPAG